MQSHDDAHTHANTQHQVLKAFEDMHLVLPGGSTAGAIAAVAAVAAVAAAATAVVAAACGVLTNTIIFSNMMDYMFLQHILQALPEPPDASLLAPASGAARASAAAAAARAATCAASVVARAPPMENEDRCLRRLQYQCRRATLYYSVFEHWYGTIVFFNTGTQVHPPHTGWPPARLATALHTRSTTDQ